jgi:hypothetical protein
MEVAILEGGARIDDAKGANVFPLAAKHVAPPRERAALHVRMDVVEAQPRVREHADDALVWVLGLVLAQPHRDDPAEEEIDGPNVGIPLALFVADLAAVEKRIHDVAPGPLPAEIGGLHLIEGGLQPTTMIEFSALLLFGHDPPGRYVANGVQDFCRRRRLFAAYAVGVVHPPRRRTAEGRQIDHDVRPKVIVLVAPRVHAWLDTHNL